MIATLLRLLLKTLQNIFTRTTVTGLQNIPTDGATPLIFAANHASTIDGPLMVLHIPVPVRPVGPGDFELLFPGNILVKRAGVILIQRGKADRESLKQMSGVLKNGENLALFPEGGTWEKRLDDAKPGVAYLSHTTGARIVPVSIGGSYQVWGKIFALKRPRLTLHFEPPLPPVEITDRKKRAEELDAATLGLMKIIYSHLPADEQARYDLAERQIFSATLFLQPDDGSLQTAQEFPVLAELISKPNLFSPLYKNLKLPLDPLLNTQQFSTAQAYEDAIDALLHTFTVTMPEFNNYRLGDAKAARIIDELNALKSICQTAKAHGKQIRFEPRYVLADTPLPPNQ